MALIPKSVVHKPFEPPLSVSLHNHGCSPSWALSAKDWSLQWRCCCYLAPSSERKCPVRNEKVLPMALEP